MFLLTEFELLGKQDSSRLPFGFVEKFAFAADRRKLIDASGSDEKKEEKDGEKPAIEKRNTYTAQAQVAACVCGPPDSKGYTCAHMQTRTQALSHVR